MSFNSNVNVTNVKLSMMKSSSMRGSSSLPMVSFKKASDHLMEQGVEIVASLKGDGMLPPEVECMASEFKGVVKGQIHSMMTPMTIRLRETEGSTKVKIGTLKQIVSAMKGSSFPFYRIDRLKVLYIPLFPQDEAEGKMITFSILDNSIKKGSKAKKVSSASAPLNRMSMSELHSSYFVPKGNIDMIEFGYKASGVPVFGRAFAYVCLAFYIHQDVVPATVMQKQTVVLVIDDVELPNDINKTSSIKVLCDKVDKKIKDKQRQMFISEMKNNRLEESRKSDMLFVGDLDGRTLCEGSSSVPPGYEWSPLGKSEVQEIKISSSDHGRFDKFLPRGLPFFKGEESILDTGAPDHWVYSPELTDLDEVRDGVDLSEGRHFYRVRGLEMKLGVHWVKLREVLYARGTGMPLISFKKLAQAGILDSIKTFNNERAGACKDGKVIFNLDSKGEYYKFENCAHSSNIMLVE